MEDDGQFGGVFNLEKLLKLVADAEGRGGIEDFALGGVFGVCC